MYGFEAAATRKICAAAKANVAAVHYHFGDKAHLYREIFIRMVDAFEQRLNHCSAHAKRGRPGLRAYYMEVLASVEDKKSPLESHLFLREGLHPSGLVDDLRDRALKVQLGFLEPYLRREIGGIPKKRRINRLAMTLMTLGTAHIVQRITMEKAFKATVGEARWLTRTAEIVSTVGWDLICLERRATKSR